MPKKPIKDVVWGLTVREINVLSLISQGYSNEGIARKLNVSRHSIDRYIRVVYDKIQLIDTPEYSMRVKAALWYLAQNENLPQSTQDRDWAKAFEDWAMMKTNR